MEALEPFIAEVSSKVISTAEIAKLAAVLAHGRQIDSHSLTALAAQAIELWDKCEYARKKKIERLAIYARAQALDDSLPKPESYPTPLENFLKLLMPKKRSEDRMRIYRSYLRDNIRVCEYMKTRSEDGIDFESIPIPSDEEVAKCIALDRERGFSEAVYAMAARQFLRWMDANEGSARKKRAQAGAEALKKKREKNGSPEEK